MDDTSKQRGLVMPLLSLLLAACVLSGCASFQEPDFDKLRITIPDEKSIFEIKDTDSQSKPKKPPQQQAWVEARTSRLWVSPYVDENGDYVQGHYKYIVLRPGHWDINGKQTTAQQ